MKKWFLVFIIQIIICIVFAGVSFAKHYGVPERTEDNIVVASYNINFPGQSTHDLGKLAKVIKNFDVCGILDFKDETEVAKLAAALNSETGKEWGYVFGIRTHRPYGNNHEAYAAVWRKDRAQLENGVISNPWDKEEEYLNDPFVVSFKRKMFDFILILVHIRSSDDSDGTRANEIRKLTEQINSLRSNLKERDFILAGSFYYSGTDQNMVEMADAADLIQIDPNAKSTIKNISKRSKEYSSSYDHIYISKNDTTEFISGQSKVLDATKLIYSNKTERNLKRSKKELSDHMPVWATFVVSREDDD